MRTVSRSSLPVLLILALMGACAAPATRPVYLAPGDIDMKALLIGPPDDNSAEHRQEVDAVLRYQESRTPEDVQRCKDEEEVTVFAFASVLGPWFNEKELPITADLMKDVYKQAKDVSAAAKKEWNRMRPPLADARIKPCVKLESTPSFPSGHATRGMAWAVLLAEIFPDKREAIMARGRQIGDDRALAGMHYPTDVAAGQKLGAEFSRRLLAIEAFRTELDKAKAEGLAAQKGAEVKKAE
ncbi:MAG: acid phosphatase [Phycisphaerales bacterium]|nr:acid phosphatase [Phycisphaerales bacterium]